MIIWRQFEMIDTSSPDANSGLFVDHPRIRVSNDQSRGNGLCGTT